MKRTVLFIGLVLFAVHASDAFAQGKDANGPGEKPKKRQPSTPFLLKTPGPLERLQTSPRHHEFVEIESQGGRKVKTWIVYPQVDHPATVVLLIHENRGLTDWVRATADELAEAGYIAVAPDLLSGTGPGGGGTEAYASEQKAIEAISSLKSKQNQVTAD